MIDYNNVFSVDPSVPLKYDAHLISTSAPGSVLWPGEQPTVTIQISNLGDVPITGTGKLDVIAYGTKGIPGDIWTPQMYKIGDVASVSFDANIAVKGFQDVTLTPKLPDAFGAYAMIIDLGTTGRKFVTTCVRTFPADPARVQYPHMCLDALPVDTLKRLGIHAIRMGIGYKPTTDDDWQKYYSDLSASMKSYNDANIDVLAMIGGGSFYGPTQPLGRPRPWLDSDGTMLSTKFDLAWLPSYDDDFQKFVATIGTDFGWPKGPVDAFSLWNEPWEGISISGWGADMPRYREIYTKMAAGVNQARAAGASILVGGCDSTSNAQDKLFADGKDTFLPNFDFVSIHYQGLDPDSTLKMWVDRKSPTGRVKIWDTESWVANTDDRVAAVVAADRAAGYDRAMGIFGGNVAQQVDATQRTADGKAQRVSTVNTWSVAAAVGAASHFIGERDFKEILFKNGLPWVMLFDGLPKNGVNDADDGTIVVVGDIGEEFGSNQLLFRTARGYAEFKHKDQERKQLASLPADTSDKDRQALIDKINNPESLTDATMTLASSKSYSLYDSYGNPVDAVHGKIVVPLDGRGFYLRASGEPGSFAQLVAAVQSSYVTGIEPIATVTHDMLAPIESQPTMRLSLTNVLNRSISGKLKVTLAGLTVTAPKTLEFAADETKDVNVQVTGGASNASNTYHMTFAFDAGKDGMTNYEEDMHVNLIAHKTITVDGNLDDWRGVLPQTIINNGKATQTVAEAAWYPFQKFDSSVDQGFATGYLAYDDNNFYFAAKIADTVPDGQAPDPGTIRFATRNDDEYFYPDTSYTTLKTSDPMNGRFDGQIAPQYTEMYTFTLRSGDIARLTVNGKRVIDLTSAHPVADATGQIALQAGKKCQLSIEYQHKTGPFVLQLSWQSPSQTPQIVPAAALFHGNDTPQAAGLASNINAANFMSGLNIKNVIATVDYNYDNTTPASTGVVGHQAYDWPADVRHYSYRKDPELPAGNAPNHDNVQIAFNVLPDDQKPNYMFPPGTMKGFIRYPETDYEYALNQVAPQYGGGTEIWRLNAPGLPHKEFYPRQPISPLDGPVTGGKLVMNRDGSTRTVECAIPWTEMPAVKQALDAGKTIKFSFRVNSKYHKGIMELSRGRSVANVNNTFHVDWTEHWGNELEFTAQK